MRSAFVTDLTAPCSRRAVAHALLLRRDMIKSTRPSRHFPGLVLTLALLLPGCAAAVDDDYSPAPTEADASSSREALTKTSVVASADAATDCDAAPSSTPVTSAAYEEFTSLMSATNLSVDTSPEAAMNSCTRICACCKRGNRFCCSHCDFCSGPIKVSPDVLAR